MEPNNKPVTKFNAGIAKLERIDVLKQCAREQRFSKDFEGWADSLKAMRSEISAELEVKTRTKLKEDFENKIDNRLISLYSRSRGKVDFKVKLNLYKLLDNYSDELERLEKVTGLGMPNKSKEDEATEY